jgi:hypothetical protein
VSRRRCFWTLWIASLLLVPLPYLMVVTGLVPVGRFLMLGAICTYVSFFVGSGGVAGTLAWILFGQAALYAVGLGLVAGAVAYGLGRISRSATAAATLVLVALGLVLAVGLEIYHTPFAAESARTNLLGVYR